MALPFTSEQFMHVFYTYNTRVWPMQIILNLFAATIFFLLIKQKLYGNRIISALLAFYWLWMGVVYQWVFFSPINMMAKIFGVVFVFQGLLFLFDGVIKDRLVFSLRNKFSSYIGIFFMIFGTVLYPLLSYLSGHFYPNTPTFGLPCPTTIFTFGVLLMGEKVPKYHIIIPFLWSLLGFSAALSLGIQEDISLFVIGLSATVLFLFKKQPFTA